MDRCKVSLTTRLFTIHADLAGLHYEAESIQLVNNVCQLLYKHMRSQPSQVPNEKRLKDNPTKGFQVIKENVYFGPGIFDLAVQCWAKVI